MKTVILLALLIVGCEKQVREDSHNEIQWGNDLDSALTIASNPNKIIMIDFMAEWCPPCQKMDNETFSDENIIKKSNEFIPIRIDVDKQQDIAKEYNGNARKYGGAGIPNILFLDKNKNIIKKSNEFILVRIDVDKQQNIAEEYNGNARKYGGIGIPNILFLDKEKKIIRHIVGFHDVDQLMGIMDSVLMKL